MDKSKISNTIFWVAMAYLGFWLICSIILGVFELDFYNSNLRELYLTTSLFMIPISLCLSFIKKIPLLPLAIRVLLTLFLIIGTYYIQLILILFTNSGIHFKQDLYVRNYFPFQKIVLGSNYNSVNSQYQTQAYKTTFIPPFFKSTSPIDTTNINQGRWIKISDN